MRPAAGGGAVLLGAAAFGLLLATLVGAPLLFGAVTTWAWTTALVTMAIAGLAAAAAGGAPVAAAPLLRWAAPAGAVVVLQLTPLPVGALEVVAPANAAALAQALPERVAAGEWLAASLDRPGTVEAALKAALYLLAFFVAARTASTPRRARALLVALLVLGAFQAFYGLVEQFAGAGRIFAWSRPAGVVKSRAAGTYVNPNHYAALLAMAITAAVALATAGLGALGPLPRGRWRAALAVATHPEAPKRALVAFTVVVLAAGLAGSLSKGGILSAMLGIAGAAALFARARGVALVVPLAAAAVALGGAAAGLARVLERFRGLTLDGAADPSLAARLSYTLDTLDLAWRSPLLGVGAGAFEAAFLRAHPQVVGLEHAHADYAQALAELGVPAAAALLVGLVLTARQVVRGAAEPERRRLALTCLVALVPLATHSLVDFNLRIPANALWAAALLGAAWGLAAQAAGSALARRARRARPGPRPWRAPPAPRQWLWHAIAWPIGRRARWSSAPRPTTAPSPSGWPPSSGRSRSGRARRATGGRWRRRAGRPPAWPRSRAPARPLGSSPAPWPPRRRSRPWRPSSCACGSARPRRWPTPGTGR
ncbi:MAG: O-antigen ligase family protein [Planctomycetes bacterium]|nr:O-antigen ligase family protein [Planctomycetota bacterium]